MNEIVPILVKILDDAVAPGGYLFLSQYKSMIEDLLGLDEAVEFNRQILKRVKKSLVAKRFKAYDNIPKKALRGFKGAFKASECCLLKKLSLN
jgi:hypothetical protein